MLQNSIICMPALKTSREKSDVVDHPNLNSGVTHTNKQAPEVLPWEPGKSGRQRVELSVGKRLYLIRTQGSPRSAGKSHQVLSFHRSKLSRRESLDLGCA